MSIATQPLAAPRQGALRLLRDYGELAKTRVTLLIVMTAFCGSYMGAVATGVPVFSSLLLHAMLGIALVAAGTAALNEVLEREADGRMRRTGGRPLPAGRMSMTHATLAGGAAAVGGIAYLALATNLLTGALAAATALVYLAGYTPLKKVSPICTFVGAFPGAMPPVLGWTAIRGGLEWEALALFAIVFFWQFPHFLSIAWLYREDYERAGIRMLPVVERDGRSTARDVVFYSLALIPASVAPSFLGMAGSIYLAGALLLGAGMLWFALKLAVLRLPATSAESKPHARYLLQATVLYLPLLFALLMIDSTSGRPAL
jgi:protoheme IX farnesyltransferase